MVDDGYTEYGYRGLEELKQAKDRIAELEKEVKRLKEILDNAYR